MTELHKNLIKLIQSKIIIIIKLNYTVASTSEYSKDCDFEFGEAIFEHSAVVDDDDDGDNGEDDDDVTEAE